MSFEPPTGLGPFVIDIESKLHPWNESTVSVAKLRELGGIPNEMQIVEVNLDTNIEVVLDEDAIVELRSDQAFSRRIKFKRG